MTRAEEQFIPPVSQLEFPIGRQRLPDRNSDRGGRSFYFFDFDDNVMFLRTSIFLFAKYSGEEIALSTRRFARVSRLVGVQEPWTHFEVRDDDRSGSFRRFRDSPGSDPQPFIEDLLATLERADLWWRGPAWSLFDHAVFNERPIAIITARGHHPDTLKHGIDILHDRGHLANSPNYLGIYTVSHPQVRGALGDTDGRWSVPKLKKAAIMQSVRQAMHRYGENPYHRFGMSDDDPDNIALILAAMNELKREYPENAFFVIDTSRRPVIKSEVLPASTSRPEVEQLPLFD